MAPLLFLAGLGVLLAKDVIALLFAADYRDAARVMPFLLLVPMLYTLSDVTSAGINLVRLPRWHMIIATLTALGNTGLNLLLVPRLGALGAAVSTGCSYLLFFALRTHASQRLLALDLRVKRLLVMLAAVAGCCAAHSLAPDAAASYVATIVAMLLCTWLYRYELQDVAGRLARALAESRR
jgi:O-antigen/teichoic acid export membrane protein